MYSFSQSFYPISFLEHWYCTPVSGLRNLGPNQPGGQKKAAERIKYCDCRECGEEIKGRVHSGRARRRRGLTK